MHAHNNNRRSWISMFEQVISENNINITSYQYKTKHIGDLNKRLLSQDKFKALLKTKLQSKFKEIWSTKTTEMSNLSFYRQHKINHKFEEKVGDIRALSQNSGVVHIDLDRNRQIQQHKKQVTGKMEPSQEKNGHAIYVRKK